MPLVVGGLLKVSCNCMMKKSILFKISDIAPRMSLEMSLSKEHFGRMSIVSFENGEYRKEVFIRILESVKNNLFVSTQLQITS